MHSFLQVARESVNFAICFSPLETPSILFLVDCSGLSFTSFSQGTSVYRFWTCANPKSKEKQNISDESQFSLLSIHYLFSWSCSHLSKIEVFGYKDFPHPLHCFLNISQLSF